jgi:hypothetical protein
LLSQFFCNNLLLNLSQNGIFHTCSARSVNSKNKERPIAFLNISIDVVMAEEGDHTHATNEAGLEESLALAKQLEDEENAANLEV